MSRRRIAVKAPATTTATTAAITSPPCCQLPRKVAGGTTQSVSEQYPAANPAFDVTPCDLVTAIVTDRRVIHTARGERP